MKNLIDSKSGYRLDIGCGANKIHPDWVGIDYRKLPGVDIAHNLEKFPYPLPDGKCITATAIHVLEHINPAGGIFIKMMDEIWRIMKVGGEFGFEVPYAGSHGYFQDPTHINPINQSTLYYFDPEHESNLWSIYKPKPWQIKEMTFHQEGNLRAVLIKRKMIKKYEAKW